VPEELGFSSERLARIGPVIQGEIEKGQYPGAVILETRAPRDPRSPFRRETPCSVWKREPARPLCEVPVNAAVGGGIEVECAHGA